MHKDKLNKTLRKFGVEIHGVGYLEKLRNTSSEKDHVAKLKELCGNTARTIFDVGASIGVSTEQYSKLFPTAVVHAFEPNPQACMTFKEKNGRNSRVILNEFAISSKQGTSTFNLNRMHDTSSFLESRKTGIASSANLETVSRIEVKTETLDNYCYKAQVNSIDLLKIDVQGFEIEVLGGGRIL